MCIAACASQMGCKRHEKRQFVGKILYFNFKKSKVSQRCETTSKYYFNSNSMHKKCLKIFLKLSRNVVLFLKFNYW